MFPSLMVMSFGNKKVVSCQNLGGHPIDFTVDPAYFKITFSTVVGFFNN